MNIFSIVKSFVPGSDALDRNIKLGGNSCEGVSLFDSVCQPAKLSGVSPGLLGFKFGAVFPPVYFEFFTRM